jgi:hypothetical protein
MTEKMKLTYKVSNSVLSPFKLSSAGLRIHRWINSVLFCIVGKYPLVVITMLGFERTICSSNAITLEISNIFGLLVVIL